MSKREVSEVENAEEDSQWVSASKTANWMRNDPLLDYLEMYQSENPRPVPKIIKDAAFKKSRVSEVNGEDLVAFPTEKVTNLNEKSAHAFILEQGNQFEKAVLAHIRKTFKNDKTGGAINGVVQIANTTKDIILESKANETLEAMQRGVPFIYQGVLHDWESKTFGSPDFLVRSDYLSRLVKVCPLTKKEWIIPAPKLFDQVTEQIWPPADPARRAEGFHFDPTDLINLNVLTGVATKLISGPKDVPLRSNMVNGRKLTESKFHYVVVDVKYSTLKMRADGIHLTNGGNMAAYKAQMYIYHRALTRLQGVEPKHTYLLGRNWSYMKKGKKIRGRGPFEKLGSIDFTNKKLDLPIIARTDAAVSWIRRLRDEGMFWTLTPKPSVYELYPNMSNKMDAPWHEKKKELAESIREITLVWYCGPKQRKRAHDAGYTEWTDPELTTDIMGFKKRKTDAEKPRLGDIIEQILDINRDFSGEKSDDAPEKPLVMPEHIRNNLRNWQAKESDELDKPIEFFVDFETIHDATASTAESNAESKAHQTFGMNRQGDSGDLIFMVGVGWIESVTEIAPDGTFEEVPTWRYKNFTAEAMTYDAEKRMLNRFYDCIQSTFDAEISRRKRIAPDFWTRIKKRMANMARLFRRGEATLEEVKESQLRVNLYHWGHIEPKAYERAMERHPREKFHNELIVNNWVNFYDVMRNEPIVMRGALSFGLKAIVKSMKENGLIDIEYDTNGCSNGIEAMADAVKIYRSGGFSKANPENWKKMNEIIAYNEVDCKAVFAIINYLRTNHGGKLGEISTDVFEYEKFTRDEPSSLDEDIEDIEDNEPETKSKITTAAKRKADDEPDTIGNLNPNKRPHKTFRQALIDITPETKKRGRSFAEEIEEIEDSEDSSVNLYD